jgi:hypothetical protein
MEMMPPVFLRQLFDGNCHQRRYANTGNAFTFFSEKWGAIVLLVQVCALGENGLLFDRIRF